MPSFRSVSVLSYESWRISRSIFYVDLRTFPIENQQTELLLPQVCLENLQRKTKCRPIHVQLISILYPNKEKNKQLFWCFMTQGRMVNNWSSKVHQLEYFCEYNTGITINTPWSPSQVLSRPISSLWTRSY